MGRLISAEPFQEAKKPAYRLWIEFGDIGVKKASAEIASLYKVEELFGRLVLAVVNFPLKQVAGFTSEVPLLGAVLNRGDVVLVSPERDIPPG